MTNQTNAKQINVESVIARHQELVRQQVKDNIDTEINALYDDIEASKTFRYTRKLPLNLFEEHFLPYFKGEVKEEEHIKKVLTEWAVVSGHVGTPVDIINPEGEVLFTIPAQRDATLFDPSKSEAISFALRQYNSHATRSPRAALAYLINNGDKIAENLLVDNIKEEKIKRWDSFAKYYQLGKYANGASDKGSTKIVDIQDEFDFD